MDWILLYSVCLLVPACMDSRLEVLEYVYSRIVLIKILASNNYLSKKYLLYECNTNIRTSRLNNQLL